MSPFRTSRNPWAIHAGHAVSVLLLVALPGCALRLGPRTIPGARFSYNQAITRSWDEQLLLNLVRLRYRDTPFFLEVNSVVAQYSAGGNAQVSSLRSNTDALNLSAGINYSEHPTITYSPLQGEQFTQRLLSPIPYETLLLLSQSGWNIGLLFRCCIQEFNGILNPPSVTGPMPTAPKGPDRFSGVAKTLGELQREGLLDFNLIYEGQEKSPRIYLRRSPEADDDPRVRALRDELGLQLKVNTLEVTPPGRARRSDQISLSGRSLLGVLFFLSLGVEPPPEHRSLVSREDEPDYDWSQLTRGLLRIRSSNSEPGGTFVRVHYRGYWFYVADNDVESKTTLNLLTYLFSIQASSGKGLSPLLTVPLGE